MGWIALSSTAQDKASMRHGDTTAARTCYFYKTLQVIFSLNSILSAFVIQVRPVLVERTFRGATHCEKKKVRIDPLSAAAKSTTGWRVNKTLIRREPRSTPVQFLTLTTRSLGWNQGVVAPCLTTRASSSCRAALRRKASWPCPANNESPIGQPSTSARGMEI